MYEWLYYTNTSTGTLVLHYVANCAALPLQLYEYTYVLVSRESLGATTSTVHVGVHWYHKQCSTIVVYTCVARSLWAHNALGMTDVQRAVLSLNVLASTRSAVR